MSDHRAAVAWPDHTTCHLRCCTPTGDIMLAAGLLSLVIPAFVVQPPSTVATAFVDRQPTPLDFAHAPPGPPPKITITSRAL